VLCAVTIPPADLRSLSSYYYVVCGRMCISSLCLVFLSVGDLLVHCLLVLRVEVIVFWSVNSATVHKQITNRQEHQTHTDDIHMRPHTA